MTKFQVVLSVIAGLLAIAALGFYFNALDLALLATFAPRTEAVRQNTFEQSRAYNDGMIRDLENIQMDYVAATTDQQRAVLRATALHRFSVYPASKLPPDLQAFYQQLKNN